MRTAGPDTHVLSGVEWLASAFQNPEKSQVPGAEVVGKSFLKVLPEIKLERGAALCKYRLFWAESRVRDETEACAQEMKETNLAAGGCGMTAGVRMGVQRASNTSMARLDPADPRGL